MLDLPKGQKPHWVAEKKLRVAMQLVPVGDLELTAMKILTVFERAKTDEQRADAQYRVRQRGALAAVCRSARSSAERLALLRKGFEAAVKDPALVADANIRGFVVEFIAPDFVEGIVRKAFAADPALIEKVRNAYSGK